MKKHLSIMVMGTFSLLSFIGCDAPGAAGEDQSKSGVMEPVQTRATSTEGDSNSNQAPQRTYSVKRVQTPTTPVKLVPNQGEYGMGADVDALFASLHQRQQDEVKAAEQLAPSPRREELLYEKREYVDLVSRPVGDITLSAVHHVYEASRIYFREEPAVVVKQLARLGFGSEDAVREMIYPTEGNAATYGATSMEVIAKAYLPELGVREHFPDASKAKAQ